MKKLLLLIGILILTLGCLSGSSSMELKRHYEDSKTLFANEDYSGALVEINESIKIYELYEYLLRTTV